MSRNLIPGPIALRIWEVLCEHAGARDHSDLRLNSLEFVIAHSTGEGCREFRFCGSLGFGGKFRNDGRPWRVDCYHEDLTTARLKAIEATNAALLALQTEVSTEIATFEPEDHWPWM